MNKIHICPSPQHQDHSLRKSHNEEYIMMKQGIYQQLSPDTPSCFLGQDFRAVFFHREGLKNHREAFAMELPAASFLPFIFFEVFCKNTSTPTHQLPFIHRGFKRLWWVLGRFLRKPIFYNIEQLISLHEQTYTIITLYLIAAIPTQLRSYCRSDRLS